MNVNDGKNVIIFCFLFFFSAKTYCRRAFFIYVKFRTYAHKNEQCKTVVDFFFFIFLSFFFALLIAIIEHGCNSKIKLHWFVVKFWTDCWVQHYYLSLKLVHTLHNLTQVWCRFPMRWLFFFIVFFMHFSLYFLFPQ